MRGDRFALEHARLGLGGLEVTVRCGDCNVPLVRWRRLPLAGAARCENCGARGVVPFWSALALALGWR